MSAAEASGYSEKRTPPSPGPSDVSSIAMTARNPTVSSAHVMTCSLDHGLSG